MGKISNTSKYATVTPTSSDYMVATDVSDSNNTKTVTVGSMASPMLGSLPSATPAIDDKLIGLDTSDSDNAKKFVVSDVLKSPVSATAAIDDKLIGLDTNDSDTPKRLTVSDVLKSPASATAAIDDKLIGLDTSDSDNPKQLTVSDVLKTPPLVTADVASDHFLLLDASDSSNPKKALITDITSLSGYVVAMDAKTASDQTLAGTATKTQVLLAPNPETNTHADLAADGTITLKSLGNYIIQTNFNVGNVGGTASVVHIRYEINGALGSLNDMTHVLPASVVVRNMSISFPVKVTSVNTTVKFFFGVKTGGNAGFVGTSTVISGMAGSPPTAVMVYRAE